jgi:hypothetical protein
MAAASASNESKRRFWDVLTIPLLVGLILALAAYFIPRVLESGKRLSYTVEKPTDYLSERLQGVTIQVNGIPTTNLFVTKVRVWNSGSVALKDLGVLFEFNSQDQNFKILNVAHNTKPSREFGSIAQTDVDDKSVRFIYSLLNRSDEDTLSFLTNESVEPKIYAKAEDLKVVPVAPSTKASSSYWDISAAFLGLIGALASFVSTWLASVFERKRETTKMVGSLKEVAAKAIEVQEELTKTLERKNRGEPPTS